MRNDPPEATLRLAAQCPVRTHYAPEKLPTDWSQNGRNFSAFNASKVNVWLPSSNYAKVLAALSEQPQSATQLAARLRMGHKRVMQILRLLHSAGKAERLGEEGSYRYRLQAAVSTETFYSVKSRTIGARQRRPMTD